MRVRNLSKSELGSKAYNAACLVEKPFEKAYTHGV